jgi:hypothetical protein
MLYYSADEQRRINQIMAYVRGDRVPNITINDRDAYTIACFRFYLGMNEREGMMRPSDADVIRIILCKLIDDARSSGHPERVNEYIVTLDRDTLLSFPIFQRSAARYISFQQRSGFGSWQIGAHESIFYSVCYRSLGGSAYVPVMIHRPTFEHLQEIYAEQVRDADQAAQTAKATVKDRLMSDDSDLSAEGRRRSSAEGRGKCFCCDVPKPRGTRCRICGYVPQGSRS